MVNPKKATVTANRATGHPAYGIQPYRKTTIGKRADPPIMNGSRFSGMMFPPLDFPSLMYMLSRKTLQRTIAPVAPIPANVSMFEKWKDGPQSY